PPPTSWSKEAIFTLIGVLIAVSSILVTLILASTRVRQWFRWLFDYCKMRKQKNANERLRQRYNEWVEFREWVAL
ncbi:hypothetical protein CC86DRAFT_273480, partial [Ophiobolus disseminans]